MVASLENAYETGVLHTAPRISFKLPYPSILTVRSIYILRPSKPFQICGNVALYVAMYVVPRASPDYCRLLPRSFVCMMRTYMK